MPTQCKSCAASLVLCLLAFSGASLLRAQAVSIKQEEASSATIADDGPAGIVPFVKGFNLSLGTTSQHDSSNGWSSLITPNAAYRFNRHFSVDVGAPIYTYINVVQTKGTKLVPVYTTVTKHFIPGDTALNVHAQVDPKPVSYELTGTLGLPSGNDTYGLGRGTGDLLLYQPF